MSTFCLFALNSKVLAQNSCQSLFYKESTIVRESNSEPLDHLIRFYFQGIKNYKVEPAQYEFANKLILNPEDVSLEISFLFATDNRISASRTPYLLMAKEKAIVRITNELLLENVKAQELEITVLEQLLNKPNLAIKHKQILATAIAKQALTDKATLEPNLVRAFEVIRKSLESNPRSTEPTKTLDHEYSSLLTTIMKYFT